MKAVTELAHLEGAKILWDLSHSVGAVPIYLKNANVQNIDLCIRASPRFSHANATSRRVI